MEYFYGRETSGIDQKGRCTIPSIYRKKLDPGNGGEFILVMSGRGCLKAYPRDVWEEEYSRQISSSMKDKPRKSIYRLSTVIFSRMAEVQMDKQGRILIPEFMREFSKLDDTVQVNGCHSHLELWCAGEFVRYEAKMLSMAEENDEELPITY